MSNFKIETGMELDTEAVRDDARKWFRGGEIDDFTTDLLVDLCASIDILRAKVVRDQGACENWAWEYAASSEREAGLRVFVEECSQFGVQADLTPTTGGQLGDGRDYVKWSEYLKGIDSALRLRASRVLANNRQRRQR